MEQLPEIGSTVFIRQRQYIVEDVVIPASTENRDLSHVVSLSCIDDDAQGQSLTVLWEKELDKVPNYGESWADLSERAFDDPQIFS